MAVADRKTSSRRRSDDGTPARPSGSTTSRESHRWTERFWRISLFTSAGAMSSFCGRASTIFSRCAGFYPQCSRICRLPPRWPTQAADTQMPHLSRRCGQISIRS
eukprot:7391471-Prymnesium_polylepis.3